MPRVAIAFVVALMLLTGIVLGQLRGISSVRSDLSQPSITPQKSLASDIDVEATLEIRSTLSPIEAAISPRTPRLERLTIERFAQHSVPTHGGTIVAVETGELTVHVSGLATSSSGDQSVSLEHALSGVFRLKAGESVAIAPHAAYRLSNNAMQSARLLVLTVPHYDYDRSNELELTHTGTSLPLGVVREETVDGEVIPSNQGPFRFDLYRVAPPGLDLAGITPPGALPLFVASETLLATRVMEVDSADAYWIVTISNMEE